MGQLMLKRVKFFLAEKVEHSNGVERGPSGSGRLRPIAASQVARFVCVPFIGPCPPKMTLCKQIEMLMCHMCGGFTLMRYLFDGEEDGRQPFAFFLELQMRSWRGGDQHKRARYKYKKRIGQTSTHSTPPHPTHPLPASMCSG